MGFKVPHFSRKWKNPNIFIVFCILELFGTVAALALFGIASPNLYRTKLWQAGSDHGFNSSPKEILYAYANHRPIPTTPWVWSQALTDYNVAISVLSMFIMIVKAIMFSLHIWFPLLSVIVNAVLTGLYAASLYGQAGPDRTDPLHSSSSAWYITKSCDFASKLGARNYCLQAKGAFAVTVMMMALFLANLILSIWTMIPTASERAANNVDVDDMQMMGGNSSDGGSISKFEMNVRANTVPFTPRTLAFNTLDRQLPLRSQQIEHEKKGKLPRFA